VGRLIAGGYGLLDAQFMTDHLAQFGAVEMARADYRRALAKALPMQADFYRLAPLAGAPAAGPLQAITQTS
jgi:leucyl/phenylalanyl-tRNA--protein transferase